MTKPVPRNLSENDVENGGDGSDDYERSGDGTDILQ